MSEFKNIVVAVDLYDKEHPVLTQAMSLAKQQNAKLHVVHVMPSSFSNAPYAAQLQDEMDDEAEKRLNQLKKIITHDNYECYVEHGSTKQEIVRVANDVDAGLIVTGSHGKHGVELILGSTANGVVHLASCDVLTVRIGDDLERKTAGLYDRILIASDFSEKSADLVAKAKRFLNKSGQIFVVNVVPDTATLASMYVPDIESDIFRTAKEHMHVWAKKVGISEKDCHIEMGSTKAVVTKMAKKLNADLVAVGSHGRNVFESALLGSTSNAILHSAKQDVYVVRV